MLGSSVMLVLMKPFTPLFLVCWTADEKLQVCILCLLPGDCVYLMRDSRRTPDGHPVRQSYRLLSHINREKLDIFRIEKLWKNEKYVQGIF